MRRTLVLLLAMTLPFAFAPAARAADVPYGVQIDGRRLDIKGKSALLHRHVIYIDVVRAVRAFDGLLTFRGGLIRVTILGRTLSFTSGSTTALLDINTRVRLPGAPFSLQGVTYVPLDSVARLAGAKVVVLSKSHRVNLISGSGSLYATIVPTPAPDDDDVLPSPAQALGFTPAASVVAGELHVSVAIQNKLPKPFTVLFPTTTEIMFVVERNGTQVWRTQIVHPNDTEPGKLTFAANETKMFTASWPQFSTAGAGRYELRVRLMTLIPLEVSPYSIGVSTPGPGSTG